MKKTSHQTHWWIDLGLLVGYLLAFYLDLTGVVLHQWIGVTVTLLALVHLLLHWDWATAVFHRFFGKTSRRSRLYMFMDILIMFGAVIIFESGLMISTWFNLNLVNYASWLDIHIYSSVITLGMTVLKIGLHWRWVVSTTNKIFARRETIQIPQLKRPVAVPVPVNQKSIDRRHFLMVMGAVGAASAVAASNVFSRVENVQSAFANLETASPTAAAVGSQVTSTTASVMSTQIPATQATVTVPTATTVYPSQVSNCTVRCPRGCSYPGHCRRYTDSNKNNRCDLGECL
jgi:hypothetical protein